MTPDQITFELSGGAANSDPLLSFGGAKSGTPVEELQSTVTINQGADKSIIFDAARIGDGDGAHVDKWLLLITGANALSAARVVDFRSSDGRYKLELRMAGTSVIGDIYRLFDLDSLFHEATAQQCALGHTDYRLIYVTNTSGDLASGWQAYLRDYGDGPSWAGVDFEIFAKDDADPVEGTPADEETPPAGLDSRERFTRALAYHGVPQSQPYRPRTHALNFAGGEWRALYVKRIVPTNQRRQPYSVGMLVVQMLDAGSATIRCGCLFPFGLLGFTPQIAITPDRGPILTEQQLGDGDDAAIRIGHGARFAAEVRSVETGLVVPDLELGWSLDGPGQLWTPEAPLTDSAGIAKATFSAPSDATKTRRTITAGNFTSQATLGRGDSAGASFSHTIAAGVERILLAISHAGTDVEDPADLTPYGRTISVTYGGERLSRIANAFNVSGYRLDLWYLLSPPVGTADIAYTLPAAAVGTWLGAFDFCCVDQVNPFDVAPSIYSEEDDPGTTVIHSFETVTDGAMLFGCAANAHPLWTFINQGPGQTQIMQTKTGEAPHETGFVKVDYKLAGAAGSDSISWSNFQAGSDNTGVAVALRAALTPATLTARV